MSLSWWASVLFLLLAIVLYPVQQYSDSLNSLKNERILLLTAHPDDECMFFTPTLQALTLRRQNIPRDDAVPHVYSLCLSTGDADGLGYSRTEELSRSLDILGVPREHRALVDHPNLKDNITLFWNSSLISDIVSTYVLEHRITTVLTFDHEGISGHPNHRSLPEGVQTLVRKHKSDLSFPPPRLFVLVTRSIVMKYSGFLSVLHARLCLREDHPLSWLPLRALFPSWFGPPPSFGDGCTSKESGPEVLVAISGIPEYLIALKAMRQHWSQLVWFRWLYVLFSRYMWVNELVEITIVE